MPDDNMLFDCAFLHFPTRLRATQNMLSARVAKRILASPARPSLAYAKARENFAQQVVRAEFSGDASQSLLR